MVNPNGAYFYNSSTAYSQSTPATSTAAPVGSAPGPSSITSIAAERIRGLRIELPIGSEVRNGQTVFITSSGLARAFDSSVKI